MKIFSAVLLFLALGVSTAPIDAATHAVIPVWPHLQVAPALRTYKSEMYPGAGKIIVNPVRWPTLIEYLAPKNKATGCAIISCPGGGYGAECVYFDGTRDAKWFNRIGVSFFVLLYRLPYPEGQLPPSGVPWPLQDVRRAVQIVRANAKN